MNAPALAEERGIARLRDAAAATARDFTDLVRVTVVSGGERTRVVGTTLGRAHRPHLLEAWGSRFNLQLERAPRAVPLRGPARACSAASAPAREARDQHQSPPPSGGASMRPASDGGREPDPDDGGAVMIVTADSRVPQDVVDASWPATASWPAARSACERSGPVPALGHEASSVRGREPPGVLASSARWHVVGVVLTALDHARRDHRVLSPSGIRSGVRLLPGAVAQPRAIVLSLAEDERAVGSASRRECVKPGRL